MDQNNVFDVLIIGAGPIGLACGIEAQAAGLSYIIIEKGCLVNSLFNYPRTMTFFSTADRLEIGDVPFVSLLPKPKRDEALEYYRRVHQKFQLNSRFFEQVQQVIKKSENGVFEVKTTQGQYLARHVIVSTGFYDIPNLLDVPGEQLKKVFHYYQEPHVFSGQRVVVVGASNSAIDAALETYRKGAEVTLVIRGPEIGPRVKYWVRPDIENRIAAGEIKALFKSQLTEIKEKSVRVATPNGEIELPNDFVIALTGYKPNFEFLKQIGIQLAGPRKIPVHNPDNMETNVKGIYLAGVVCGGLDTHLWFIENSRIHATQIIDHICKGRS